MKKSREKQFLLWARLGKFTLNYRWWVIFCITAITAVMAFYANKVEITYEFARLLPDDDEAFVNYRDFKKTFGEDGSVMVIGIEDPDFFKPDKYNDWFDLSQNIKKVKGIKEVVSICNLRKLVLNDSLQRFDFLPIHTGKVSSQEQLDSIRDQLNQLPFYEGFIYKKDVQVHLMAISFDNSMLNSKNRLSMVDSIKYCTSVFENKYHTTLHYSGLPFIRTTIARKIAGEMGMFLGLAFAMTTLVLLLFFRSFLPVFISLLVVFIGVIWSFGTIVLLGYKITVLSGLIPPLIIVIGIPNCVLLLNKYHTEYLKHKNKPLALATMVEKIGVSTFFANITTSIGFAVFCVTNSSILVEFGLVASLNVMGTYATSLVMIPALFSLLPSPDEKHTSHLSSKPINWFLKKVDYWVHHHRKSIYIFTIALLIISVWGISHIKIQGYVVDDLPANDPIYTDMNFFQNNFNGVLPFEISIRTLEKGKALGPETLSKINRLQKVLKNYPELSKPLSATEAVKFSYQAFKGGEKKYYILPGVTDLSRLKDYTGDASENKARFKSFIDSTNTTTRVSVQMADVGSTRMKELLNELKPRIDSIFPSENYKVSITGHSVMFLKGNNYLLKNLKESLLLAVVLITIVMLTLFMSFRMVVISIVPSIIPLLLTAAMMGFIGIPLKPSTILVFSIAFGIASDGNMYFLTKYRQEYKLHGGSISKTVSVTLKETGVSMIYTAIILFCGFGIFSASSFGGTAALGYLISFTLLISYLSNLILLPSFLLSLEKKLLQKAMLEEPIIDMVNDDSATNQ